MSGLSRLPGMTINAEAGAHSNIIRKVESLFMIVQFQVLGVTVRRLKAV